MSDKGEIFIRLGPVNVRLESEEDYHKWRAWDDTNERTSIQNLRAEVERMRPVVEAAVAFVQASESEAGPRSTWRDGLNNVYSKEDALVAAVAEYERTNVPGR